MAAGEAAAGGMAAAEGGKPGGAWREAHPRAPGWAREEDGALADDDVLVHVAHTWQPVIVGPFPAGDRSAVITGGIPVPATWAEVPVVRADGTVLGHVLACLIG